MDLIINVIFFSIHVNTLLSSLNHNLSQKKKKFSTIIFFKLYIYDDDDFFF